MPSINIVTPTDELGAVNQLLATIGESPVSSLSGDVGVDVVTAKNTLAVVSRDVQLEGWLFNTELEYPLSRDVNGEIAVPTNALKVDTDKSLGCDPVWRGTRMYDREGHTYVFTSNLKATVVVGLPFEELPQSARHYITIRAARIFQDQNLGSTELHRFNATDELKALELFEDDQTVDAGLNMLDTI